MVKTRTFVGLVLVLMVMFCLTEAQATIIIDDEWQEATVWYSDGAQGGESSLANLFDGTDAAVALNWWGGNWTVNFTDNDGSSANGIDEIRVNLAPGSGAEVTHIRIIGAEDGSWTNGVSLVDQDISGFGEHVFEFPMVTGKTVFQAVFTQNTGGWYQIQELDAVPEPTTMGLLMFGIGTIVLRRKRR